MSPLPFSSYFPFARKRRAGKAAAALLLLAAVLSACAGNSPYPPEG
jgi:hypothetical protein